MMRVYIEVSKKNEKGYHDFKAGGTLHGKDETEVIEKARKIWGEKIEFLKFETFSEEKEID